MKKKNTMSLRTLFIIFVVFITVVIFSLQTFFSLWQFTKVTDEQSEKYLVSQAEKESSILYGRISNVAKAGEALANTIASTQVYDDNVFFSLIEKSLEAESLLFGSGYWMEPNIYKADQKYYGPYIYKDENNKPVLTWDYSNEQYNYFAQEYYTKGLATEKPYIFTSPYYDQTMGITFMTCAIPIHKDGKTIGVTTADMTLTEIRNYVSSIKVGQKGYAYILTSDGYYWAKAKDPKEDLTVQITKEKDPELQALGTAIMNSKAGGVFKINNSNEIASYAPIGDTGLKLVLIYPASEALAFIKEVTWVNIGAFVVAILIFIALLSLVITRTISNPLKAIIKKAEKISLGDLSAQGDKVSEKHNSREINLLSDTFSSMAVNMRELISQIAVTGNTLIQTSHDVKMATEDTKGEAEHISFTALELAKAATNQAEITQEGHHMVMNIIGQLTETVSNSKASGDIIQKALVIMQEGVQKVALQKEKMQESKNAVDNVKDAIGVLSDKSKQIGEIVDVIDGIAEQTNLLALNAAIEAARAGEQGKGFAVVAGEVKKLAEQSASATQKIGILINEIQRSVSHAVQETDKSETIMAQQKLAVEDTSIAFSNITQAVEEVSRKIADMVDINNSLSNNSEKVASMIEGVASISEENAACSQEVAASIEKQGEAVQMIANNTESLVELANRLNNDIQKFKI